MKKAEGRKVKVKVVFVVSPINTELGRTRGSGGERQSSIDSTGASGATMALKLLRLPLDRDSTTLQLMTVELHKVALTKYATLERARTPYVV